MSSGCALCRCHCALSLSGHSFIHHGSTFFYSCLPHKARQWTTNEVIAWLKAERLEHFVEAIKREHITGRVRNKQAVGRKKALLIFLPCALLLHAQTQPSSSPRPPRSLNRFFSPDLLRFSYLFLSAPGPALSRSKGHNLFGETYRRESFSSRHSCSPPSAPAQHGCRSLWASRLAAQVGTHLLRARNHD